MQAARKAVETIKETAANIGASAKSGLEKTKATVQEKVFYSFFLLESFLSTCSLLSSLLMLKFTIFFCEKSMMFPMINIVDF